jgi:hypothetical protein
VTPNVIPPFFSIRHQIANQPTTKNTSHLAAQTTTRSVTLKSEQFKGVTSVSKTVRYHFPANMRGVVMFNHGTGGSGRIIESAEAWPIALSLIADGYGVVSIDAEEAVAGDQDGNGKLRWNSRGTAANVDLRNIQALFDSFISRKLLNSTTRKFALGMSAGGAFSHFLGTVRSTSIAANFPQLRFAAVVSYCADATGTSSATVTQTPSAWYMCGAEDNPEVSNAEAKANEAKLRSRGIATQYFEHQPSPLYDGRFARIARISSATSKAMAAELRKAGLVDTAGFIKIDGDQVAARVRSSPSAFPQISANPNQAAIKSQIKTMRAEHSMFADFTRRTVDFFNRFNPR